MIQKHAVFPGPFQEVPKMQICHCQIDTAVLHHLLKHLNLPLSVQKYAFRTMEREVVGGLGTVELACVDRNVSMTTLAAHFIMHQASFDEAHEEGLPDSSEH
jgi:hypothetical protein